MSARLIRVSGRVQGVGYRAWLMREAEWHGIWGWVRNRSDGTVEALLAGEEDALEALLLLCRRGPALALVRSIEERFADAPPEPGFIQRPTL